MSKLTYYVSIERTFSREEIENGFASNFDLRAWEDSFPADTMEYWHGHGTSLGYSKLTLKSISKSLFKSGRKRKAHISAVDVGFSCDTKEEAFEVLTSLEPFVDHENTVLRLSSMLNIEE
tara:strand:+ start:1037 stop:1396 length:360 start_codon:yes stop_codon:yes gene_type:complete